MKTERFPLMIRMNGANLLFVGGGKVAERKISAVLHSSPNITVISPEVTDKIRHLSDLGQLLWRRDSFRTITVFGELDYVFIATNDSTVNQEAAKHFKGQNIPVNIADSPFDCDFHMPAVLFEDGYVISVSTDGQSPEKARKIKEKIADWIHKGGLDGI
jgi:siroheme synthase-like protein